MRLRSHVKRALRWCRYSRRNAVYHFIHIPKNAGEAVRDALYWQRDVSLSSPFHYRYVDIADEVGRELRFFAVIRNPWSRTASRYQFARQNALRWAADDPRRQFIQKATFRDFVVEQRVFPIPEHPGKPWMGPLSSWYNQLEWIRDERGIVSCECIRMESLEKDLTSLLGRNIQLRQRNVTQSRYDYRDMYTDETRDIVGRLFRDDIDYFGFTFEGPAARNVFSGTPTVPGFVSQTRQRDTRK